MTLESLGRTAAAHKPGPPAIRNTVMTTIILRHSAPGHRATARPLAGLIAAGLGLVLCLMPAAASAKFEPLADLETVSVATEPDFLVTMGRSLQQTWILLNFKQEQRIDMGSPEPMGNKVNLAYRSRKDYVQVDCKRNLYTELASQMFPEAEGKGNPVYESTFHRSGLPRFATPSSHEGAVLAFLCRGVRPN